MFKFAQKLLKNTVLVSNINPKVVEAQYAVRGKAVIIAGELERKLSQPGNNLPFKDIIYCNIGNPLSFPGAKHIQFNRDVFSLVMNPELLKREGVENMFKPDVIERAKLLIKNIPGNTGSYSHSKGIEYIRKDIVNFINERDGFADKIERPEELIYITDGASPGVHMANNMLIRGKQDGIMIPIPQYPLYSASIALYGGSLVGYYLDESKEWGVSMKELERSFAEATQVNALKVRSLVVINPGNPTGQVMDRETQENIINFCLKNKIVLLADEVYQENIYAQGKEFNSFRKVAKEMGDDVYNKLEMISFHSVSKGFLGECGRRGGYFQLSPNWNHDVQEQFYKLSSVNLCSNVDGQIMVDLMVNPPKPGDASYEEYKEQKETILNAFKIRAKKLCETLNGLEGVTSNPSAGAMYAFPKITLPPKAIEAAKKYKDPITGKVESIAPDLFYALTMLEECGICVVPGSGFGQVSGTFHYRTTFLPPTDKMEDAMKRLKKFHSNFMKKYQ